MSTVIGHLCAMLLVFSQIGQWSVWFDQVNHFVLILVPLALLAIVHKALRRLQGQKESALVLVSWVLIFAIVVTRTIAPELVSKFHATTGDKEKFKVVAANVFGDHIQVQPFVRWVMSEDPDVVLLAEARTRLVLLLERTYPYRADCLENHHMCSTLLLSKTRLLASRGLATGDPENRKSLSAVEVEVCVGERPLMFVGVHLARPIPVAIQARDIGTLLGHMEELEEKQTILLGDFNLTPWSFALRRFDRAVGLRRVTKVLATWPANLVFPFMGLDHIYVSPGIRAEEVHSGPPLGSDHKPVVATLSFDAGLPVPSDRRCASGKSIGMDSL